jgi:HCO3- transporter family
MFDTTLLCTEHNSTNMQLRTRILLTGSMVMCATMPCRRLLTVGIAITCFSSAAVAFISPQPLQTSNTYQISSSARLHAKHSSSAAQPSAPTMSLGLDWARSKLQQRRRARVILDNSLLQQQQQQQSVRCSAQSSAEDIPLSYLDQLSQQASSSVAAAADSESSESSYTASTTPVTTETTDTETASAIQGIVPNKDGKLVWGRDLARDFRVRFLPYYKDDWTCGLTAKSVPAIMFLYFACLLPAVAFGGIAVQVTAGSLGVIEYLVACGSAGMVYALFSGQVSISILLFHFYAFQHITLFTIVGDDMRTA